jgi:hypothetical protein
MRERRPNVNQALSASASTYVEAAPSRAIRRGDAAHVPETLSAEVPPVDRDVLLARAEIAEAYYHGGDALALSWLASASLRLYPHVLAGQMSAPDLFDSLQECAANLGIAGRAQDDVQAALAYGPNSYT